MGETITVEAVISILDETQQAIRYSRELERKSHELEETAEKLRRQRAAAPARHDEGRLPQPGQPRTAHRSEEHTSELQSLMRISYAVFCLKKKTKKQKH